MQQDDASRCCALQSTVRTRANWRHWCRPETAIAPDFTRTASASCATDSEFRNWSERGAQQHRRARTNSALHEIW